MDLQLPVLTWGSFGYSILSNVGVVGALLYLMKNSSDPADKEKKWLMIYAVLAMLCAYVSFTVPYFYMWPQAHEKTDRNNTEDTQKRGVFEKERILITSISSSVMSLVLGVFVAMQARGRPMLKWLPAGGVFLGLVLAYLSTIVPMYVFEQAMQDLKKEARYGVLGGGAAFGLMIAGASVFFGIRGRRKKSKQDGSAEEAAAIETKASGATLVADPAAQK